ncbi:MAG: disulfide oxidoreductase [Candidatus Buchananbacteria bacterium]
MAERRIFAAEMTIAEALALHPRAAKVFKAFHLGGCRHCAMNDIETVEKVCSSYHIDLNAFLEALNALVAEHPVKKTG